MVVECWRMVQQEATAEKAQAQAVEVDLGRHSGHQKV